MKKIFESDTFLKILSVVIAVLLWLYIIVVLDPPVEVEVRDLPIQFVGQEQLQNNGISVVNESATSINLKVKGSRKKMGKYDMKTIIAKVDLSGVWSAGQHTLPVDIVVPFEHNEISYQSFYDVIIQTEKTVWKKLELEIATEGSTAMNYMPGDMSVNPKAVSIKGPESVIGKIEKAGVVLNYGGADVDITQELPIHFYDIDGKALVAQDALLKRITQDIEIATVECSVVKLRTVKIVPQFWADTEDERELLAGIEYTLNPATVQIYGEDEITAKITEISTEGIPMEKFTDNHKAKVKLILPYDVKVLKNISEVEITLSRSMKAGKE